MSIPQDDGVVEAAAGVATCHDWHSEPQRLGVHSDRPLHSTISRVDMRRQLTALTPKVRFVVIGGGFKILIA